MTMTLYRYWTAKADRPPMQLMCVRCGAVRPTLHMPELRVDPVTTSLGWMIDIAMELQEGGTA